MYFKDLIFKIIKMKDRHAVHEFICDYDYKYSFEETEKTKKKMYNQFHE